MSLRTKRVSVARSDFRNPPFWSGNVAQTSPTAALSAAARTCRVREGRTREAEEESEAAAPTGRLSASVQEARH